MKSIGLDDFQTLNSALIPDCCLQQRLVSVFFLDRITNFSDSSLAN